MNIGPQCARNTSLRRVRLVSTVLLVGNLLPPAQAAAQRVASDAATTVRRISVDVTAGPSAVRGGRGPYVNDEGVAAELLVGFRRPAHPRLMRAVAIGVRSDAGSGCYVLLSIPPPNSCAPKAPTVSHLTFLTGYEFRRGGSSMRALLGPALYSDQVHAALGGRLHVNAAVGAPRVALTAGVNGNWLALANGSSLRYYSGAFGLRIQ